MITTQAAGLEYAQGRFTNRFFTKLSPLIGELVRLFEGRVSQGHPIKSWSAPDTNDRTKVGPASRRSKSRLSTLQKIKISKPMKLEHKADCFS